MWRALELPNKVTHKITHEPQARGVAMTEGKWDLEALTVVHYILEPILQGSRPGIEAGAQTHNIVTAANTLLRLFSLAPLILITAPWDG